MKIRLKFKNKKLQRNGFQIQFTKKDTKELAMNIGSMIQARVPQGKDYHGEGFGSYSAGYEKAKEVGGGRGLGSTVNLTWTGAMLSSLDISKDMSSYGGSGGTTGIHFTFGPSLATHKRLSGKGDRPSNNAIGYFIHTGKLGRYGKSGPIVQRPPRHWLGLTKKQGQDLGDIFKKIFKRALGRKMNK